MVNFLESQIGLLERQTASPDVREVEDMIAFHLTALERLEDHIGSGGLSESDRRLVPLFQCWLHAARRVKALAQILRDAGPPVRTYDDLLRAINRCKPVAENFDYFVKLNSLLANAPGFDGVLLSQAVCARE